MEVTNDLIVFFYEFLNLESKHKISKDEMSMEIGTRGYPVCYFPVNLTVEDLIWFNLF